MYQIAATLPLLRPVLKKILDCTGIARAFRSQNHEDLEANVMEKPRAVQLDSYHQEGQGGKRGNQATYSDILRVTDVSVSEP
jgi:hypothetical protein